MARVLQPKPVSSTVFRLRRWASVGASSEASTEPMNSGRKMLPYWLLDSPYPSAAVRIVAAAGKLTRARPWAKPPP
jgi:hypothetical protein